MAEFNWLGDNAILYKGRLCMLTGNDGWEVVRAMDRIDEEIARERQRLKEEIKAEVYAEMGKDNDRHI